MKRIVALLFRKPGVFFSIERVFGQLEPELEPFVNVRPWTAPYSGFSPGKVLRNIFAARSSRADIYHITGDMHYLVLGLPRKRTLLTIHDCIFLYQSSGFKRLLLKSVLLDLPVRHCALITTISESTRKDILRHTKCPPEKVLVIPNPVNHHIRYVPRPFPATGPALLFIGNTPNKNLPRVIQALEGVPCRLQLVGVFSSETEALLKCSNIRYEIRVNLTDQEMADQYINTDIVLFPSTYEGFGLPVVEGQKAGRPVITSDLDPMREVAGGAACLVDPYSAASIREGVMKVIHDHHYREGLVQQGFQNVERFDAKRIAQQYLSCYRQLLPA